jgi:hypothetical protein
MLQRTENLMQPDQLPQDPETLILLAEEIANIAGQRLGELGVGREPEVLLRASIAAATFARSAYLAMVDGAAQSPIARRFLVPAGKARDRTEQLLRHRLAHLIAEICLFLDDEELSNIAEYVCR